VTINKIPQHSETVVQHLSVAVCAAHGRGKAVQGMSREQMSTCEGLRDRILQACKQAQHNPTDQIKLAALRLIECAIVDRDVCARARGEGTDCADHSVRCVLETLVQQFETSAAQHDREGRIEDAIRERSEAEVIKQFLPQQLSDAQLITAVNQIVEDLGAGKLTDLGRCVTELKQRYPDQTVSHSVSKVLRTALTKPH